MPSLLGLGLLADRQVFAANWDALSHVLVAAPLGQGADSVLGALLASLVAQRSPAQLGLVVVGSPRRPARGSTSSMLNWLIVWTFARPG
jgi:hypothetical protein